MIRSASVAFIGGSMRCTVLDVSAVGARLRLAQPVEVGMLMILHLPQHGECVARRIWQRGLEFGVAFQRIMPQQIHR